MDRISIITRLYVAPVSVYPSLTLVDGLPDTSSLDTYFDECPLILEGADLRESAQDNEQGQLLQFNVRARIGRESDFYQHHANKLVLLYIETVNGEHHFLGSDSYPLLYLYDRDSGTGNADPRDTVLTYSQTVPL